MSKKLATTSKAYKGLLATQDGLIILKHLMVVGNFSRTSYVPNDPHSTSFNEGRRSVVLEVLRHLNMDDKAIYELINKSKEVNND